MVHVTLRERECGVIQNPVRSRETALSDKAITANSIRRAVAERGGGQTQTALLIKRSWTSDHDVISITSDGQRCSRKIINAFS